MSHIDGHIDYPARSFGVLSPVKSGDKPVPFQILFAKPADFAATTSANPRVGFHPYLVPWEDDADNKFCVIASDLVVLSDHKSAESKLIDKIDKHKYFRRFSKPGLRIEELVDDLDEIVMELIDDPKNGSFKIEEKNVLRKTLKYMKTSSFKTIYMEGNRVKDSNAIIDWIVDNTVRLETTGFELKDNVLAYK